MQWIANHTWIVPVSLTVAWILFCWFLINFLTGGMAGKVVLLFLVMGLGGIWLLFGFFHLLLYILWNNRLIE